MSQFTTVLWKRLALIGMMLGILGSTLLPASITDVQASPQSAQTTTGSSFEWSTPDGSGGSTSFDEAGVYAKVDTANPRYDGLCHDQPYRIVATVDIYDEPNKLSTTNNTDYLLSDVQGVVHYFHGPVNFQGAQIRNERNYVREANGWVYYWDQLIEYPIRMRPVLSGDVSDTPQEAFLHLGGSPVKYKPYDWNTTEVRYLNYIVTDYELIPVELNGFGRHVRDLPREDANNNCGTYYEVSFYPSPLGPDDLPDTGDEPIETFGPDGLPGTDDDLPIGGGITDDPGSLRQTSGGGPGDKEEKPERCATHTHRIPADFSAAGVNIQYGWFRVERRVCFDNIRVTRIIHSKVFLDMDDPVRALNMLSHHQIEFDGAFEPWEGHPQGAMNTFWEFSIRLDTPEIRVPGFTIPFTERQVGSFTLPAYTGEIEKPAIRIISLANGCYFATPGGGDDPICPPGSYK